MGQEYNRVRAVFDTDGADVRDLAARARREGIEPVPSTPTFETRLILHLDDHRAPLLCGDKAEKRLKALMPRWTKGGPMSRISPTVSTAPAPGPRSSPRAVTPAPSVHLLIRAVLRSG